MDNLIMAFDNRKQYGHQAFETMNGHEAFETMNGHVAFGCLALFFHWKTCTILVLGQPWRSLLGQLGQPAVTRKIRSHVKTPNCMATWPLQDK